MNWHKIRKTSGGGTATLLIFLDTETHRIPSTSKNGGFDHVLRLGVAYAYRREGSELTRGQRLVFYTAAEFWDWLDVVTAGGRKCYVFAHNALFDLGLLDIWHEIDCLRITLSSPAFTDKSGELMPPRLALSSPPVIIPCKLSTGADVTFLDTLNYIRKPLASIGELVGLSKGKPDFATIGDDELIDYCENDVQIIVEMVSRIIKFSNENGFGGLQWTMPAMAMSAFRANLADVSILCHDQFDTKEFERNSFYASEIECYRVGVFSGVHYLVDCNSLYPSVMIGNKFPRRLVGDITTADIDFDFSTLDFANTICHVVVNSQDRPVNIRFDGLSMRVTGKFDTVLPGPDLVELAKLGLIERVLRVAVFDLADIFSSHVGNLLNLRDSCRKSGDKFGESMAKMLANSLFGKFAQRGSKMKHRPDIIAPESYCCWSESSESKGTIDRFMSIGWIPFQQVEAEETESSFPAISSFVASHARQYMNNIRAIAGQVNCYYQGVDCLLVTENGYRRLESAGMIDATAVGKFKVVDVANRCEVRGTCDYSIGDRHVVGRTPRRVAERDGDRVRVTKFYVPRPDCGSKPHSSVYESDEWLTLSKAYRKGKVQDDGYIEFLHLPKDFPREEHQTPF